MSETCQISDKIRHKKTDLREKTDYILKTYSRTLKAYVEVYGTKDITESISESVLSMKDLRMVSNAKLIKLNRHRKQLKENQQRTFDRAESEHYRQVGRQQRII